MLKTNVVNLRLAYIEEIDWHTDCFDYLVIDKSHKDLIMGLVHTRKLSRDKLLLDSGKGNGRGLVMLFQGYVCTNLCRF